MRQLAACNVPELKISRQMEFRSWLQFKILNYITLSGQININFIFQDAREAQERLEKLEAKIKYAFDNNKGEALVSPGGAQKPGAEDKAGLYNEIAQIQKEKLHKQKLMFELQKVEQEIHKKMVENVHRSILPQGAQGRVRIMKNL